MTYRTGRCLIVDYLEQLQWTQRDLSRRSAVSKSSISEYIRKEHEMRVTHAKNIADALGCTIEELYEWLPERKPE